MTSAGFQSLIDQVEWLRLAIPPGQDAYLVGGAVRDAVRGVEVKDFDFAVAGDALALGRKIARTLQADFFPLDAERQSARVIVARPDGSRINLDFIALRGGDLRSDLSERDFTINAMALDPHQGQALIDPLGGLNDLRQKTLRACSEHALLDDPLRTLRGVRLALELGLRMPSETMRLVRQAAPGLAQVSPERVRDELFRILQGPQPAGAVRLMDYLGMLEHVLPEVSDLKGITQSPPHTLDAWEHTLQVVERLDKVLRALSAEYDAESAANWTLGLIVLRIGRYRAQIDAHFAAQLNPERSLRGLLLLAALLHDTGKATTRQVDDQGRARFFEHEQVGESAAGERGRILRLSNAEVERLKTVVRHHMRPLLLGQLEQPPARRAVYRFYRATGEAGVDICLLSLADMLATYGTTLPRETWMHQLEVTRTLLEAWWDHPHQSVTPPALINGKDLMETFGLAPGPQIGALLEAVREAQAAGLVSEREQALELVRRQLETSVR